MHIQVAYAIIMKQSWRGGAEAVGGGGGGRGIEKICDFGVRMKNEKLALIKRMLDANLKPK